MPDNSGNSPRKFHLTPSLEEKKGLSGESVLVIFTGIIVLILIVASIV